MSIEHCVDCVEAVAVCVETKSSCRAPGSTTIGTSQSLAGLEGRHQKGATVGPGPERSTPWPQALWRHLSPKVARSG